MSSHKAKHSSGPGRGGGGGRNHHHHSAGTGKPRQQLQRAFFTTYWTDEQVNQGLAQGRCVTGSLRINKRNRNQAFVHGDSLAVDVYLDGDKSRNRALDGDIVVVELMPLADWRPMRAADNEEVLNAMAGMSLASTDANDPLWQPRVAADHPASAPAVEPSQPNEKDANMSTSAPEQAKISAPAGSLSAQIGGEGPAGKKQPVGRVIAMLAASETGGVSDARLEKHIHVGTLHPSRGDWGRLKAGQPIPAGDRFIEFHPLDTRVPYVQIARTSAPFEFVSDPVGFSRPHPKLFECKLLGWNEQYRFPSGEIVRQVGQVGEIGPETDALLIENCVDHGDFSEEVLECLEPFLVDASTTDKGGEWQIPADEIASRKDLRSTCIFTIDPLTAKDLDDALHCTAVPAGKVKDTRGQALPAHFEIGVHIADVSHFVPLGSALDLEARRRATSVYLVQKVLPMLPPLLSEQLCSLNPGVDRLAFSCIWRMSTDGTLVPNTVPWIGRTVIRCCAKLDYGLAQDLVDGTVVAADASIVPPRDQPESEQRWAVSRRPEVGHPGGEAATGAPAVIKDLKNLYSIAMNRRAKRFEKEGGGALALSSVKLAFTRDNKGNPTGMRGYPLRNTNRLVEEYMLLANYLTAEHLILIAKKSAFLRRHPAPEAKGMAEIDDKLRTQLAKHKLSFRDITSAGDLHEVLEQLRRTASEAGSDDDGSCADLCTLLEALLRKPMKPAVYFCAGQNTQPEWRHWALNIPYYTHFTSPIRRYADVCVHRELVATIAAHGQGIENFSLSQDKLGSIADTCNEKKEASKAASMDSDTLFLNVYIRSLHDQNKHGKGGGGLRTRAIVQDLGDESLTLLLPELGVDKRVHAIKEWHCSRVRAITDQPDQLTGEVSDAVKQVQEGRNDGQHHGRDGISHRGGRGGHSRGRGRGGHGGQGSHSHGSHGGGQHANKGGQHDDKKGGGNNNKGGGGGEQRAKVKELELIWKLKDNKEKKMTLKVLVAFDVVLTPKYGNPKLDFDCHLAD